MGKLAVAIGCIKLDYAKLFDSSEKEHWEPGMLVRVNQNLDRVLKCFTVLTVVLLMGACGGEQSTVFKGDITNSSLQDNGTPELCPSGFCEIDGLCHPNASPNPNNACQQCLVLASITEWSNNDAGICSDDKICTEEDFCEAGECKGLARDCDDNDVCTEDSCEDDGGCTFTSIAAECDDENECTDNSCDAATGCVVEFNSASCDDGSACTENEQCEEGQCVGVSVEVDDGNPCTNDACDPESGVSNEANDFICDDGNACTVGDVCAGGSCQAGASPLDCDDGEFCTDDACEALSGCYTTPNTLACDDGEVCTVSDTCSGGDCLGSVKDCDDGNACTADSCSEPDGCTSSLIVSEACRPNFSSVYPARAATLKKTSSTSVYMSGYVESGAGPISSLLINGVVVSVTSSSGFFSYTYPANYGNNVVVFEATDSFGTTRRRVQSFMLSNEYLKPTNIALKNGSVEPGIGVFIGQEVVDDGVHGTNPVDDLATIFEMVLDDLDFDEIVPPNQPVSSVASYDIYIKNFNDLYRTVSLTTGFGVISMEANIYFPSSKAADIKAESWLPDVNGKLFLDRIKIEADITTNVVNHVIETELTNINVTVTGLDVDIGWLANWLVNFFEGYITDTVEEEFESQLSGQLGPMIGDALGALAFQTTINLQSLAPDLGMEPIEIFADPSSMTETPSGITLKMRVGAYGGDGTDYSNLGVPKRNGCSAGAITLASPKASPLEMVLSDDTLNVLVYSAWKSGLLEFDAPTDMLGAGTLIDQGISDLEVSVSGMLAPLISDCGSGGDAEIQVGDLRADVGFKLFGQPATMTIFASMAAEVEVIVEDVPTGALSCNGKCGDYVVGAACQCDVACGSIMFMDCCADYNAVCVEGSVAQHTISLSVGDLNSLEMEVVSGNESLIPFEQVVMDALNDELIPSILGALTSETIGGFPLPSIDIGGLAPGIPEGTLITLDPQSVEHFNGKVTISGDVQ